MARKDINIDILIKEFVEDNISIRKLVKKYRCRNDYISNLLKSTNDQRVLNKLRKCNEILDYKNGTIGVIACNTNNIFIFPSHLYDIFKKHKWYENKHGYLVRNNYNKKWLFPLPRTNNFMNDILFLLPINFLDIVLC